MFHPVARCANVNSLLSISLSSCVLFVISCVVKLLSSLPSCLKKKKKPLSASLVLVMFRVVTYGIRAGSTLRLWID
jgi:hypothetical protein